MHIPLRRAWWDPGFNHGVRGGAGGEALAGAGGVEESVGGGGGSHGSGGGTGPLGWRWRCLVPVAVGGFVEGVVDGFCFGRGDVLGV